MSTPSVSLVVAGGEMLLREGLKRLFEGTALRIVGEVDLPPAARQEAALTQTPAIVLAIDPHLAAGAPAPWLSLAAATLEQARVVALFSRGGDREVIAALRAGAAGCLFTAMPPAALVHAIHLVALGGNVFPTSISGAFASMPAGSDDPTLTPRERDILRGLVAGQSNKEIANRLGTTDMTVKAQLRHLLRKLGAVNRTQAALWARENGFE